MPPIIVDPEYLLEFPECEDGEGVWSSDPEHIDAYQRLCYHIQYLRNYMPAPLRSMFELYSLDGLDNGYHQALLGKDTHTLFFRLM